MSNFGKKRFTNTGKMASSLNTNFVHRSIHCTSTEHARTVLDRRHNLNSFFSIAITFKSFLSSFTSSQPQAHRNSMLKQFFFVGQTISLDGQ